MSRPKKEARRSEENQERRKKKEEKKKEEEENHGKILSKTEFFKSWSFWRLVIASLSFIIMPIYYPSMLQYVKARNEEDFELLNMYKWKK